MVVDGIAERVRTDASSVAVLLGAAHVHLAPGDVVVPSARAPSTTASTSTSSAPSRHRRRRRQGPQRAHRRDQR